MFDTIILLTGEVEQPVLTSALRKYRPEIGVQPIISPDDLDKLDADGLKRARLVAFATTVIVRRSYYPVLVTALTIFIPDPRIIPAGLQRILPCMMARINLESHCTR